MPSRPSDSKIDATPANKLVKGGVLSDFVRDVALPLHTGDKVGAACMAADFLGVKATIKNDQQALVVLQPFLQYLLDQQRYTDAARLLWTPNLFSGDPNSVTVLWDSLFGNALTAVPGAASMGKSYNLGVWLYLDWRRDPWHTNVQIVGPSEDHLERNIFSHLVRLHRNSAIPGPGEEIQRGITLDKVERRNGIFGVVVPIGKKASGRLQGVKVEPRPKPHPQFGPLSRLRVMLEEAENIPVGIYDDLTNIVSNARGVETFKAALAYNPKDPNHPVARIVEPIGKGINEVDVETEHTWKSKRGWNVVRLDAYKSENVISGEEKFFGLQTKDGLQTLISQAGGVGTPGYFTMARGWYPPTGVDLAVIPMHLVNDVFGEYHFIEAPRPIAGLDVALEGGDNAIMALGRFGLASGWYRLNEKNQREFIAFKDDTGTMIRREVAQLDQIFKLPKGKTEKLVEETKRVAQQAGVAGDCLGVDRVGNGAGVHDLLTTRFSPAVHGINGSRSATETRIFAEDKQLAHDEYADLLSELWFALRKYIEFGHLKIHPNVPRDPIIGEMTGRQSKIGAKKTKVEPKKDYKSRGNTSPDRADALTIMLHVARQISGGPPSTTRQTVLGPDMADIPQRIGLTDRIERL